MIQPGALADVKELYIEFAGRQLTVRTNDRMVEEFLRDSFRFMLVPRANDVVGELEILLGDEGHAVRVTSAGPSDRPWATTSPLMPFAKGQLLTPEILPRFNTEVSLRFIVARPDLLWLHAGAVERGGSAILLGGASGQGKSTLTTLLCQQGWHYLSDEVAPIRIDADTVLPFPQSPRRRSHTGIEVEAELVQTLKRETVQIKPELVRHRPTPIRAFVFLEFRSQAGARLDQLAQGPATLEIIGSCTNFADHRAAGVERAARLARAVPMYRLSYGHPADAMRALEPIL